jgi:hypothetical protein
MVNGLSDATRVVFDDQRVVANAGVMLPAFLAGRLGLEALVDQTVDLGERPGAPNPGRKVMSLLSAMCLGADCIEDCGVLRSGQTRAVLGHRVAAPSTLGTFLRAFTFGHVRQLDRVLADSLQRAWAAGAGPEGDRLVAERAAEVAGPHLALARERKQLVVQRMKDAGGALALLDREVGAGDVADEQRVAAEHRPRLGSARVVDQREGGARGDARVCAGRGP